MIRHHAIRQDPATTKIFIHSHENAKLFPLFIAKDKSPLHDPRNAVINRRFFLRILPWCHPTRASHALILQRIGKMSRGFYKKGLSLFMLNPQEKRSCAFAAGPARARTARTARTLRFMGRRAGFPRDPIVGPEESSRDVRVRLRARGEKAHGGVR